MFNFGFVSAAAVAARVALVSGVIAL